MVAIENVDERPTAIRLLDPGDSDRRASDITVNETTRTVARKIADIRITDDGLRANRLEVTQGQTVVEIRNATRNAAELWLKGGQRLERGDGDVSVSVGLARDSSGEGGFPPDVSLNVRVNDVPEKPRVTKYGTATTLPLQTGNQPFDTGLVFFVNDPDNLDGGPRQEVTMLPLADTRFELVEDREYVQPQRGSFTPGLKKYSLMVKANQDLSNLTGRSVTLSIKGRDNSADALESDGIEVTLNGAPPVPGGGVSDMRDLLNGQDGAPDIREVDTTPGSEASADLIENLESHDRIRIDLPHVLVRTKARTIDGRYQSVADIFSPHDLTFEDNYLAVVVNSSLAVLSGIVNPSETSYFASRSDEDPSVTKAYHLVERTDERTQVGGPYKMLEHKQTQRDAFVIDKTPGRELDATRGSTAFVRTMMTRLSSREATSTGRCITTRPGGRETLPTSLFSTAPAWPGGTRP